MATCAYCGSTIIMGGVQAGGLRYCNNKCHQSAYILAASQHIPPDVIERELNRLWRGNCPKCQGAGPVDVHRVYEVWSAAVLTRWTTKQQLSCRSCATKRQLGGTAFSLVLGWWGFPWGLILTPVQVTRNVIAMCGGPDRTTPSGDLRKLVQVNLGARLIAGGQPKATPPPLPPQAAAQ